MGFLKQDAPVVDYAQWSKGTRAERIVPMARHWAEVGFGTPIVMHLFYVVKILLYVLAGWLIVLLGTAGLGGLDGFTDVGSWYAEPIVYQKAVFFTMLFEVVGLGCGFGPLNNRFIPPLGSILYWLRPNTIRLPPWPGRIPLTEGDTRTPVDALLYAALLVMLVVALFSDGTGPIPELGSEVGVLPVWQTATTLGLLAVCGLRDKVIFLAARGEVYGSLAVCFLFSGADIVIAAKLVCLIIWIGAATSKLNKHFPFVISTMMSNNPVLRPKWIKRRFFEHFPDDLRPGRASRWLAHFSTAIEGLVPVVLFFSHGGSVTAIAAFIMVCFHFGILSAIPMGVPLEWNVFMMFSVLALFVGHAAVGLGDLHSPWPILLFIVVAGTVAAGALLPVPGLPPGRGDQPGRDRPGRTDLVQSPDELQPGRLHHVGRVLGAEALAAGDPPQHGVEHPDELAQRLPVAVAGSFEQRAEVGVGVDRVRGRHGVGPCRRRSSPRRTRCRSTGPTCRPA